VRDFRIDVRLIGTKTLVICRWDAPHVLDHVNANLSALGATMTRAAPDRYSSGHQQAISYVHLLLFSVSLTIWVKLIKSIGYLQHEDGISIRGRLLSAQPGLQCNPYVHR
jgi:hypothetical protein